MSPIAYLLGQFPVLTETFISNEIRALEALGHTVFPIALHRPQAAYQPEDEALARRTRYFAPIEPQDAQTLSARYTPYRERADEFISQQSSEPSEALFIHAADIAEYLSQNGCSHLHAHFAWGATTYAIAAAKLAGVSVSFTCHGSDVYARPIDLALKCQQADAVIGVPPSLVEDLRPLAAHTPCHLVHCGVDVSQFKPAASDQPNNGRWLYVGRLIECKGIDDILSAWQTIPKTQRPKLDIIGDGPLREALEQKTQDSQLNDSVNFLGAKASQWIAEHGGQYKAFISAFKQGSDGSQDTSPMVLKEAMAMQLPIVTTTFRDIPALVGEGAMLVETGDTDALAQAVMEMDSLPATKRQAIGQKGLERVLRHYSLKRQAEELSRLFQQIQ